jgi:cytochrome P450
MPMQTPPVAGAASVPPRLRHADALPGPRRWPLFGSALQIEPARLHRQLEDWARLYGSPYRLQLGSRRIVVVGDHALVAAVLRDRPDGFRRTSRLEQIWTELGLQPFVFGLNGEPWRRQRRMVMAAFDPGHVNDYFPAMQVVAQRLVQRWQLAARRHDAIDLQADLMRYTVDTIAGLAFGAEVNTLQSDGDVIQQHLDKIFPALFRRVLAPLPTWRWWRTPADWQLAESIVAVKTAVDGFVGQARARLSGEAGAGAAPQNLLEAMIVAADQEGSGIDDAQVAGNVLGMLLAGEDTTAHSIAWMVHLLWRHPAALQRARDEVRRVVAADAPATLEQLAQLDYLDACVDETMRLKPVAPILPLEAMHDLTVGDVQVPAGYVVINLMRLDSLDDAQVPRAAEFLPERWLDGGGPAQLAGVARRSSMPFGAGPRICPGRYLALLEMKLAMVALLGHFDIDAVDTPGGAEATEHLSFTMAPVGLRMRLHDADRGTGGPAATGPMLRA